MSALSVIFISALTTLIIIGVLFLAARHMFARRRSGLFRHKSTCHHSTSLGNNLKTLETTLDFVEAALKLEASQLVLWDELKTSLARSQTELYDYKEVLAAEVNFEQRINRLEDFVNDSLIILQRLKPQLVSFYHALNNQQQEILNNFINKKYCKFAN